MIYTGDCLEVMKVFEENSVDSICLNCGIVYKINPKRLKFGRGKYCSPKCQYEYISKISKESKTCPVCNKNFVVNKSNAKRFCSPECAYKARAIGLVNRNITKPYNCVRKQTRLCIICNTEYVYKKITQKYCSHKCCDIHKETLSLGENNPAWVNGNSYKKRSYRGNEWGTIRLEVYKRDLFTCQICGVKCVGKKDKETDRTIQCHHIENYKISKNNNMSNLITVCLKCHLQLHK
jgi:5-methylcytosine-specific restriction endonuclease McrA